MALRYDIIVSIFAVAKNRLKYFKVSQTLFSSCVSNNGISLRETLQRTTVKGFQKWESFIWHTGWEKGSDKLYTFIISQNFSDPFSHHLCQIKVFNLGKPFTGLLWRVSPSDIPLFDTNDEKKGLRHVEIY